MNRYEFWSVYYSIQVVATILCSLSAKAVNQNDKQQLSPVYSVVGKQRELSGKDYDCKYMNSPPCECIRTEAEAVWGSATARDLPSFQVDRNEEGNEPANEIFPSYILRSDARATTTCSPFAIELAGGYGGERGLQRMKALLVTPSGGSVDVFAHLFAHTSKNKIQRSNDGASTWRGSINIRDADNALAAAFSDNLRDVVFEIWDPTVMGAHIRGVVNNKTGALDWLEAELSRRYSRIFCGKLGVPMGSPEQKCRRTWPQVLVHSLSMWRKIYLASALRRRFESEHSCSYKFVVRTRPDYVMLQELDLRRFLELDTQTISGMVADSGDPLLVHTAHTFCGGFQRPHKTTDWCQWRVENWPAKACFADDQFALGDGKAMEVYARLFPDFDRWAWWYPLNRKDGFRHLSERLLVAYLDWRQRASLLQLSKRDSNEINDVFRWDSKLPNGSAAHLYHRLDRSLDHRLRGH